MVSVLYCDSTFVQIPFSKSGEKGALTQTQTWDSTLKAKRFFKAFLKVLPSSAGSKTSVQLKAPLS